MILVDPVTKFGGVSQHGSRTSPPAVIRPATHRGSAALQITNAYVVQAEFLNTMPPREFVDCITDDLLGQGVFVFTPSGAPMRLPKVRLPSCGEVSMATPVSLRSLLARLLRTEPKLLPAAHRCRNAWPESPHSRHWCCRMSRYLCIVQMCRARPWWTLHIMCTRMWATT